MSMLNPLARARGHGSAKDGVHHWYAQRASALLLIALLAWLLFSVLSMDGLGYASSRAFIANPVNAALLSVLLVAALVWFALQARYRKLSGAGGGLRLTFCTCPVL